MGRFSNLYTFETFVGELETYLKANLNTVIGEMNTDKSGEANPITLAEIPSAAYYFQSIAQTEVPYTLFVYYGETGTASRRAGPDVENAFDLQVAILIGVNNEDPLVFGKRLQRYRECLKEVIRRGWNTLNKRVKLDVTGISPFPFSVVNNQDLTHVGIGVTLNVVIT